MSGLSALLESKKAVLAAVASAVNMALVKWGGLTIDEAVVMTSPLLVAIGAQGFADFGKYKAGAGTKAAGLFLAVGLGTLFLGSCAADGSLSVVAHTAIVTPDGAPGADVRWDGDTLVAIGGASGVAEVFTKHTGFPVLGPVLLSREQVYVKSNSRDFEEVFAPGMVLPAWLADLGLFRPGEAEQLGLTFELPQD